MNVVTLARWQFGITTVYHFLMVPLTIGLALVVAWFQTCWYRTGDDAYLRLTKFFGKLFLINFAMGVVTGIVQEFQFGMNWAYVLALRRRRVRSAARDGGTRRVLSGIDVRRAVDLRLGPALAEAASRHHLGRRDRHDVVGVFHRRRELVDAASGRGAVQPDVGPGRAHRHLRRCSPTRRRSPRTHTSSRCTAHGRPCSSAGSRRGCAQSRDRVPDAVDRRRTSARRCACGIVADVRRRHRRRGERHIQTRLMFEQQPMKMASAEGLCNSREGRGPFRLRPSATSGPECDVRSFVIPKGLSLLATDNTESRDQGREGVERRVPQPSTVAGDYRPNLVRSPTGASD